MLLFCAFPHMWGERCEAMLGVKPEWGILRDV